MLHIHECTGARWKMKSEERTIHKVYNVCHNVHAYIILLMILLNQYLKKKKNFFPKLKFKVLLLNN